MDISPTDNNVFINTMDLNTNIDVSFIVEEKWPGQNKGMKINKGQ
jgi:hypothetical protein